MTIAQQVGLDHALADAPAAVRPALSDHLVGLLLVTVVPGLFWTAVLAVVAPMLGWQVSTSALWSVAVVVACFLAAICQPLMSRSANRAG